MSIVTTCVNCPPKTLQQILEIRDAEIGRKSEIREAEIERGAEHFCTKLYELIEEEARLGRDPAATVYIKWDNARAIAKRVAQRFEAQGFSSHTEKIQEYISGYHAINGRFFTVGWSVTVEMPTPREDSADRLSSEGHGRPISQAPAKNQSHPKHALNPPKAKGVLPTRKG